jgi:hypothetical protein
MPKVNAKGDSSRKPPVVGERKAVEDWIGNQMPGLQPILKHLDKTIRETIPELEYAVKWKKAYYGLPNRGWLIELVAYDVSVNIVFLNGEAFETPPSLGEGRGRYVKLRDVDDAKAPEIKLYIEQAKKADGWK